MYLCTAPLSRFYYPETQRFINAFYYYYYYRIDIKQLIYMDEFVVGMKKDCLLTWMNARIEKRQLIYMDEFMEGLTIYMDEVQLPKCEPGNVHYC